MVSAACALAREERISGRRLLWVGLLAIGAPGVLALRGANMLYYAQQVAQQRRSIHATTVDERYQEWL
jgi:hypothetical protein